MTIILKVNWYAHGARYYDPQLARWHSSDPLSELYSSSSPYGYVRNNPDASGGWRYDWNSETYNNAIGGGSLGADDFNRYIMPAYAELYITMMGRIVM